MAVPLARPKIVKKKTNKFKRHQSDRFATVKESWRRPKGIDSRVRRKFKGKTLMPNIGYGSNKKTKHVLCNAEYLRDLVAREVFKPEHVPSSRQLADAFTKALPRLVFAALVKVVLGGDAGAGP